MMSRVNEDEYQRLAQLVDVLENDLRILEKQGDWDESIEERFVRASMALSLSRIANTLEHQWG